MSTLIETSVDAIVIERGWYPLLGFALRQDGHAVPRVIGWRGGAGDVPPTGFIRPNGTLTADPAEAFVFPGHFLSTSSSGSVQGDQVGEMALVANSAVGETEADWANADAAYEIDNGLPGDTGAELREPLEPDEDQFGYLLEAERLGESRWIVLDWGAFTGATGTLLPVTTGEALQIRYRYATGGRNFFSVAIAQTAPS